MKIFLDRIEKSGGNVSVLVLQEIWDGLEGLQYIVKNLNPKSIPGWVIQNSFTFETIAIEIQLENVSVLIILQI